MDAAPADDGAALLAEVLREVRARAARARGARPPP